MSFSSRNKKMADIISTKHLNNIEIWSMSNIQLGENYAELIERELERSIGAIILLSSAYFESIDCIKEYETILEKKSKDRSYKIYPILLSKEGISEDKFLDLSTIQLFPSSSKGIEEMYGDEVDFHMLKLKKTIVEDLSVTILHNPIWSNIAEFVDYKQEQIWPLRGIRNNQITTKNGKLSLRVPINDEETDFNHRVKILDTRIEEGYYVLESSKSSLFRSLYSLFELIDDKFTETSDTLKNVVQSSIKEWREVGKLIRTQGELERGLLGELWFLEYLIEIFGEESVYEWRGPEHDRHDFRLENNEFEIKTTKNTKREHVISSIEQLEPSNDSDLFLVSIQVSPVQNLSSSMSVSKFIDRIENIISSKDVLDAFIIKVESYISDDFDQAKSMTQEYIFSSNNDPISFHVNQNFPKFKKEEYEALNFSDNISDISYKLNLSGLNTGIPCRSKEFKESLKLKKTK